MRLILSDDYDARCPHCDCGVEILRYGDHDPIGEDKVDCPGCFKPLYVSRYVVVTVHKLNANEVPDA